MGYLFKRGEYWWIRYSVNGRRIRESAHTNLRSVAEKMLQVREGAIAEGKQPALYYERVTFEELARAYLEYYSITEKRSVGRAEEIVRLHLKPFFGNLRATQIDSAAVRSYTSKRLRERAANATINRELAALKRMFRLALQNTPPKVARVPHVPMLREDNVRQGFFEHEDFLMFRESLPAYLRGLVTFGYKLGCRRAELTGLQWSSVNLKEGYIRLSASETKNKEARTIYLDGELQAILRQQLRERGLECPYVFQDGGCQIRDFRSAWDKACRTIGREGYYSADRALKLTFHDLRRTAIRNMMRAGVSQVVAMSISGHKTFSVFARYDIVSGEDRKEAAFKIESFLNQG